MVTQNRQVRLPMLIGYAILAHPALAADFSGANLRGAHLTNADLRASNLTGADLTDADLSGADLRSSNITQQQLDNACGSGTKLPPGLGIQPCRARTVLRPDADDDATKADRHRKSSGSQSSEDAMTSAIARSNPGYDANVLH
jgi:hypothetical protein